MAQTNNEDKKVKTTRTTRQTRAKAATTAGEKDKGESAPKKRGRPLFTPEQKKKADDTKRRNAQKRRIHERTAKDIAKLIIEGDPEKINNLPIRYDLPKDIHAEIRRFAMGSSLKWMKVGDNAPSDAYALAERTEMYFRDSFECGDLLTWEKYCLAIGYDIRTVANWLRGVMRCPLQPSNTSLAIIEKAKSLLANYDAELLLMGKINPVSYIFRAKNYYGMKDVQEKVTLRQELGSGIKDVEELRRKYIDSSAYSSQSDDDSDN